MQDATLEIVGELVKRLEKARWSLTKAILQVQSSQAKVEHHTNLVADLERMLAEKKDQLKDEFKEA